MAGIEAVIMAILPFALLGGLMTFLGTYIHFPKMDSRERMALSLKNAVYLTVALAFLVCLFLALILNWGVNK